MRVPGAASFAAADGIRASTRQFVFTACQRSDGRAIVILRLAMTAVLAASAVAPASAETFRRLSGAQIKARFAGMDMSDGVHWRDSYARDGGLASQSMGKRRSGAWRVENDRLCIDLAESGGCYEVWLAGTKVEFRREGFDGAILDGELLKPGAASRIAR
jgi:hypothetical protein